MKLAAVTGARLCSLIGVFALAIVPGQMALAQTTMTLQFLGIDPATGQAKPLEVGPSAGGDMLRLVSYRVTATNPAVRLQSVNEGYGPGTAITGSSLAFNFLYSVEPRFLAFFYQPFYPLREDDFNGTF